MFDNLTDGFDLYLRGSTLFAYLAAYAAGVLVSFTPCTYPLIPITVSYIGGKSRGSRAAGFFLSLAYVIGTSLTYTALGSVAAVSGSLFGSFQSSPWPNLVIANICILMGLSMLEMFSLPVPRFLSGSHVASRRGGIIGGLLLGAASGLIMSPCTTPVLGVLLSFVATKQNVFFGMSLLFVFAFGMGSLLLFLGTFAGLLATLPKAGPWMVSIQRLFGWVFIAIGEYFLVIAGKFMI